MGARNVPIDLGWGKVIRRHIFFFESLRNHRSWPCIHHMVALATTNTFGIWGVFIFLCEEIPSQKAFRGNGINWDRVQHHMHSLYTTTMDTTRLCPSTMHSAHGKSFFTGKGIRKSVNKVEGEEGRLVLLAMPRIYPQKAEQLVLRVESPRRFIGRMRRFTFATASVI
ncbi:hypothetical protein F4775DRAFT_270246 [Biscogniauxia sp. FL1348]|nr:hypothetical protein F4775DRAFT_270246 [Biscogniauxia sp. FL1348]